MNVPADIIRTKSQSVIESYRFTLARNCKWASSLTKLARVTAQECEDRFLVELIQNGYDAHDPNCRDGCIWIHYARDEGEFGTLYVGNGGKPFTESNFHAICEIAQSDKEPGAGIGNKGVGFKSVLNVCDSPEIYSSRASNEESRSFDGFCFRFARDDDYEALCAGNSELLTVLRRDVSPYFLPIHIPVIPASVTRLRNHGMVTVIRMPLKRQAARETVARQLDALRESPVPLLLFLPRLGRLVVEVTPHDDAIPLTELHRKEDDIPQPGSNYCCRWSRVVIKRTNGEAGDTQLPRTFFMASTVVDRERLQGAIRESIKKELLDERFSEWKEDAVASAAVELGIDTPSDCRLYTFLPMGAEARCPFGGYLSAPFATNLGRTHASDTVPLNSLFFDVAGEICAETLLRLAANKTDVPETVLVDLLTWDATYARRLTASFRGRGREISTSALLPLISVEGIPARGSIAETYDWQQEGGVFTAERLRRVAGAQMLGDVHGVKRRGRLTEFAEALGCSLMPDSTTLATWTESLAKDLAAKEFISGNWDNFYADVASIFEGRADALAGRQLLLDSSGKLRHAGPFRGTAASADRPTVFFPPTTERSEDDEDIASTVGVAVPPNLSGHMCYMHDSLTWYQRDGAIQRRTAARDFLQKAQLVQRFDTRNLVEHCSRISQQTRSGAVRESALRLAFSLQRAARSREALGLERLPFHVPTNGGWHLAEEAILSRAWPGTLGEVVEHFIANAHTVSADIAALESRLLDGPQREPFKGAGTAEWRDFLLRIGVKDGLWPIELPLARNTFRGDDVTKAIVGQALKLQEPDLAMWKAMHTYFQNAHHPYTDYRVESPFYRLPGQFEFTSMSDEAKRVYARLIFAGLGVWNESHFAATIERPRPMDKDTLQWPTPMAAFLSYASWVPVQQAGANEAYVRPQEAWHAPEGEGLSRPSFLPVVARDLCRQLEDKSEAVRRVVEDGRLRVLGRASDAPALVRLLGDLLAANRIPESDLGSFRRLYAQGWQKMLDLEAARRNEFTKAENLHVVVNCGAQVVPQQIRRDNQPCCDNTLFVIDTEDRLRQQLLADLHFPTLDLEPSVGARAVEVLKAICGDRVRGSSSVNIEVLADGNSVVPQATLPHLLDETTEWITQLVDLVVALKSRARTHHSEQARTQVQRKISHIRIARADTITLRLDTHEAALPSYFRNVVLINDPEFPTVVVSGVEDQISWRTLERLVPAIMTVADRASVEAEITVVIYRLAGASVDAVAQEPSDEDLAEALATTPAEIQDRRRQFASREMAILEVLYPVIYHFLGPAAAAQFHPRAGATMTRDDMRAALLAHKSQLPTAVDDLVAKCAESPNVGWIRDELKIGYAEFNSTLRALGPPYKPLHNTEGQRSEFAFFKQTNSERILASLRARFLREFREGACLQAYLDVRDLTTLQADPQWVDCCALPSEDMMQARTNNWLKGIGAASLQDPGADLPPLQQVRTEGRELARGIVEKLAAAVPVWCSKNSVPIPPAWGHADVVDDVAESIADSGLTDFTQLEAERVFRWLATNGYMPAGMPHSLLLSDLGLTEDDLAAHAEEAETQRRQREYERRTIVIDGARFSSWPTEYQALVDKIRSSLSPEFLGCSKEFSQLTAPRSERRPRGAKREASGRRSRKGRMTDAQKHAVGLVGEVLAFEWLKAQYEGVTDECWKSEYRDLVLGGTSGDDELGYDFEVFVKRGSTSYLFEVKATTGDDSVIELGATELEASQRLARSNRYRILFVPHALDAGQRRVFVLPNPFSKYGRGSFETTGAGIRYRFRLEE
jgi:hypothetical protein